MGILHTLAILFLAGTFWVSHSLWACSFWRAPLCALAILGFMAVIVTPLKTIILNIYVSASLSSVQANSSAIKDCLDCLCAAAHAACCSLFTWDYGKYGGS